MRLEVSESYLRTQHRIDGSGDDALRPAKAELLEPALRRDESDSNVGDVLSPHGVGLDEAVELRKKESAGLLLLRKSVLRAAVTTSPRVRLRLGRCTVLAVVIGHEGSMDFTEENEWG